MWWKLHVFVINLIFANLHMFANRVFVFNCAHWSLLLCGAKAKAILHCDASWYITCIDTVVLFQHGTSLLNVTWYSWRLQDNVPGQGDSEEEIMSVGKCGQGQTRWPPPTENKTHPLPRVKKKTVKKKECEIYDKGWKSLTFHLNIKVIFVLLEVQLRMIYSEVGIDGTSVT